MAYVYFPSFLPGNLTQTTNVQVTPVSDSGFGHFPPANSTLFEGPDRRRSLEDNVEPPSRPPGLEIPRPTQATSSHSSDNGAEYWDPNQPTELSRYEIQADLHSVSSPLFNRSPVIPRAPLNGDGTPVSIRHTRPVWPRPSSNTPPRHLDPLVPETMADYVPTYGGHPISVVAPDSWGPTPPAPTIATPDSDAPSAPHSPLNETPSQHNTDSSPAGTAHSNSRRPSIGSCNCSDCNNRNNSTHTQTPTNHNPNGSTYSNLPRHFVPPIVPPAAASTLIMAWGLIPPGWSAAPPQPFSGIAVPQMPHLFTGPNYPATRSV